MNQDIEAGQLQSYLLWMNSLSQTIAPDTCYEPNYGVYSIGIDYISPVVSNLNWFANHYSQYPLYNQIRQNCQPQFKQQTKLESLPYKSGNNSEKYQLEREHINESGSFQRNTPIVFSKIEEPFYDEKAQGSFSSLVLKKGPQFALQKKINIKEKTSRLEVFKAFKTAASQPIPQISYQELIDQYECQLKHEVKQGIKALYGKCELKHFNRELIMARKNLTNHFIKIIRYSILLLKDSVGPNEQIEKLQKILRKSSIKISNIINLYRTPELNFFVQFLKQTIMFKQRIPALIMALDIKPSGKLVMLPNIQGFINSVYNPHEKVSSWNLSSQEIVGDTSSVAEEIMRNPQITFQNISLLFYAIYSQIQDKRPDISKLSRYNNISYHYRSKLIRILSRMGAEPKYAILIPKIQEVKNNALKRCSINTIKELLSLEWFKIYLRKNQIQNNHFLLDLMLNNSINCNTKRILLESYPKFVMALDDPECLQSWQ